MARLSIRHPKNRYKIKILPTTIMGVNWCFTVSSAKIFGSWERAIKELKNSAPNKTRKIIPDVIAVLSITSKKDKKLKFLLKAAINPVPAAPIAAPSVGVKKPK